jgi:NAD(P)-dependent dehydrogenase (short-subunit alcohol dehydrogenase family)
MSNVPNRATLVTGCSSGIGRAIVLRLAREGWPVYASARRIELIEDLAEQGCQLLSLDVTDEASRRSAIARIENDHGAVAALVNNAGFGQQGPLEETPLDVIRAQFETNVFAAVALCQQVLPGMRREQSGRIVNMSSMGGRLSFPGGGAYHGSKYALEAITDVLRFEVAGFGIGVVLVEPGPTTTDFGVASIRSLDQLPRVADGAYDGYRAGIRRALESTFDAAPAPGSSTPEDVAEAVWSALTDADPEPRMVVGETARQLIDLKEKGTDREWDRLVAGIYPQPGNDNESDESG